MADSSGYVQAIDGIEPGENGEQSSFGDIPVRKSKIRYPCIHKPLHEDHGGKIKLGNLMDRLRIKRNQIKSWTETTKSLRMSITDKRHQSEVLEKSLLYCHLDTLQKAFKVNSLPLMLERLEAISKQVGLKFTHGHSGTDVFISSDMFYLEITLEPASGTVKDVKIAHNSDAVSCPEIKEALSKSMFDECSEHIEGLSSIYQINGDKKQRTKSYLALTSLETDLNMLSKLQSTISSVANYIHKSPLGILQPRIGGQAMKMIYFVGPFDLLNDKTKRICPMTMEAIIENKVGHSVTVGIESSSPHKLQTIPLMTINKTLDGKSLPSFSAVSAVNSCNLSAVFVLRLEQPMPMALSIIHKIQQTTGIEFVERGTLQPLTSLIVQEACKDKEEHVFHNGHHVSLPDQQHCYFMSGVYGSGDMMGAMVTKIPFTHPTSVPTVIVYLRQQVLFNTVISSCLRPSPKIEKENSLSFEVTPVSLQSVTVTFEHPFKECMATAEIELVDITAVKCRMVTCPGEEPICSDEFTTKVMQRCLSVPVMLRSILRSVTSLIDQQVCSPPPEPSPLPYCMSRVGQERRQAFIESHCGPRERDYTLHPELGGGGPPQQGLPPPPYSFHRENLSVLDQGMMEPPLPPLAVDSKLKTDKVAKNPMLASLLDQDTGSPDLPMPTTQQNSVLSALLADPLQSSLLPPPTPTFSQAMAQMSPFQQPGMANQVQQQQGKQKRPRKRRSLSERSPMGRSPKRKASEDDFTMPGSADADRSNTTSPFSSSSNHGGSTPSQNASTGNQLDESFMPESHVSRLASSLDNIIKLESLNLPTSQKSELENILSETGLRPPSRSSSAGLSVKMEDVKMEYPYSSPVHLEDSVFPNQTGDRTVTHDVFSNKELHVSTKPVLATNKRTSHSSSGKDSAKLKNHDPFEFTTLTNSDTDQQPTKCLSTESMDCDMDPFNSGGSFSSKSFVSSSKINHDKSDSKIDIKQEEVRTQKSEKREKRENRDSSRDDDKFHDKEKPLPAITVKVNTRDLTAKTILHDSQSRSPVEAIDLSGREKKDSRGSASKLSLSDSAIDLTGVDLEFDNKVTARLDAGPSGSAPSSSPRLSSGSNKKPESKDKVKSEKKRKSSKHNSSSDGLSEKKRRRDEMKREQLSKKQKIYDFDSEINESENYRIEKSPQIMKPTTIKITTTGGKMQVQSGAKVVAPSVAKSVQRPGSASTALKNKTHLPEKSASPRHRIGPNHKNYGRSKSDNSQIVNKAEGKMDSKLYKTPTIKLKPLNMPSSSTTVTVTSSSTKTSQSPISAQVPRQAASNSQTRDSASKQSKPMPIKSRKGSLSAVIDKLVSKQHSGGVGGGSGDPKDMDKHGAGGMKKDKNIYDEIRLAIVREGNKPSTPTKEVASTFKSSQNPLKKFETPKLSDKAGPLPKTGLNQSFNVKVTAGGSAAGKLNNNSQLPPIPKANNSVSSHGLESKADNVKARDLIVRSSFTPSRMEAKMENISKNNIATHSLAKDSSSNKVDSSKSGSSPLHNNKAADIKEIKEPPRLLNTTPAPPPKVIPLQKQADNDKMERSKGTSTVSSHKASQSGKVDDSSERLASRHFLDAVTKLNGSSNSSGSANSSGGVNNSQSGHKLENNSENNRRAVSNLPKTLESSNQSRNDSNPVSSTSSSGTVANSSKSQANWSSDTKSNDFSASNNSDKFHKSLPDSPGGAQLNYGDLNCTPKSTSEKRAGTEDRGSGKTEGIVHKSISHDGTGMARGVNGPDASQIMSQSKSHMTASPTDKGSEDKENALVDKSNEDVFKAPTPKPVRSEEREEKRGDSRERARSKPVLSPRSDISSPDDGLVIDCPGTPGRPACSPNPSKLVRDRSHSPSIPKSPGFLHSPIDNTPVKSPVHLIPKSPSQRKACKSSPGMSQPAKSPMAPRNSGSSPASRNTGSPCDIDDDLMNEAIIL